MVVDPEESEDEMALRERFRFLRERAYAVSRSFVDRVLGDAEQRLAAPRESFAAPFLVEMMNLVTSLFSSDAPTGGDDDEKNEKKKD